MALQKFWTGSQGPFVYDDQKSYEDGVPFQAFRGGNESFQSFGGTAVFGGSITVGSYGVGDRIIELQHDTGNAATGGAHLVEFVGDIGGGNYSSFAFSLDPDNSTATIASAGYGTKNAEPIHIYVGGNRVAKFDNDNNLTRINAPDGTLGLDIAQGGPMIMRYAGGVRMKTTSTGIEINLPSTTDPAATLNFNVVDSGDGAHIQREGSTHIDLQSDGSTRVSGFFKIDGGVLTIDSGATLGRIMAPNGNVAIEIASSDYVHLRHNGGVRFKTETTGVEIVLPSTTAVAATLNFNVVDSADDAHIQLENITYLDLKSEGPLGVNGRRIEDVTDPTNLQDVATKNYVDNTAGYTDADAVNAVETHGDINLSGDLQLGGGTLARIISPAGDVGVELVDGGETHLRYAGGVRLQTTNTGIEINLPSIGVAAATLNFNVVSSADHARLQREGITFLELNASGYLNANNRRITSVSNPTASGDVVNRGWALGNNIDHNNLGIIGSSDHHSRYSDSEAVAAVEAATTLNLDVDQISSGFGEVQIVEDLRILSGTGPRFQGASTGGTEAGWIAVDQGGDVNYIRLYNTK